jgi:laminin alpha 1/2
VCDVDTGRCVCPPLTVGDRCQMCTTAAWGYDAVRGCKPCACNAKGAVDANCEASTGKCR